MVWPESPLYFLQSYWQWISTALLIPWIGWLATLIFGKKKGAAALPEAPGAADEQNRDDIHQIGD